MEVNPNPFEENLKITYHHSLDQEVRIRVVTPIGKVLYDQTFDEKEGELSLDASSIPAGLLYVLGQSADEQQLAVKKVAKLR
ncbi:MAG: T9SS type A sorting domain-containing protein [Bacteroidota bacterium]